MRTTLLNLLLTATAFSAHATASSRDDDDDTPLPLIIWHGLGDEAKGEGILQVGQLAEEIHPGTFVYAIDLSEDGSGSDRSSTFFGNVTQQIETVCDRLAKHPILSTAPAVDAIGFSQGGQFLRGYIERCNKPPIRSLVTFGSQHNGITEFRDCATTDLLCQGAMALLRFNVWSDFVQNRVVPAQYYRSPDDYQTYLDKSNFLADINNERPLKDEQYKKNLAGLERFVMFKFEDDTVVIPKETSWFDEVIDSARIPLRKRNIYREDWIGLRQLDEKGRLVFRSITGDHMQIPEEVLNTTMSEFFGPLGRRFDSVEAFSPEEL